MILITRPSPVGEQLTQQLNSKNLPACHTPLIKITLNNNVQMVSSALNQLPAGSIVITLSQHAITPFNFAVYRQDLTYLAIGKTTATHLQSYISSPIIYPEQQISEALLMLPPLQHVAGKIIVLLKGNNGRKLLANTLKKRGANVTSYECYHREIIKYDVNKLITEWKKNTVNIIVVTSKEILQRLYQLISESTENWLFNCHLVVVSQRIAVKARQYGWHKVTVAEFADNVTLINVLKRLTH